MQKDITLNINIYDPPPSQKENQQNLFLKECPNFLFFPMVFIVYQSQSNQ